MPETMSPPAAAGATDWLTRQYAVFTAAPDGDAACRHLLAAALAQIASLEAQLAAFQRPTTAARPRSLRPAILALLRERAMPLSRPEIEAVVTPGSSLAAPLRRLVRDARLTLADGRYTLPGATPQAPAIVLHEHETTPATTPAPATTTRGGRRRKAVAS
jgi:hypothetical protein